MQVLTTSRFTVSQIIALSIAVTWLWLTTTTEWIIASVISHDSRSNILIWHVVSLTISCSITHHLELRILVVKIIVESITSTRGTTSNLFPVEVVLIVLSKFTSIHIIGSLICSFRSRRVLVILNRAILVLIRLTLNVMEWSISLRSFS